MNDRFTRGFLAGLMAAVPAQLWNVTAVYLLKVAKIRWSDFALVFILGRKKANIFDEIVGSLGALFFASLMGSLFAYVFLKTTRKNYLFKGWVYGVSIWFIVFALTFVFKVPELSSIDLPTAIANFVGASIWGLLLGYTLKWLDRKVES